MGDRFCMVCGDQALCVNFNGLTCKSCKSFFRRYALKKKVSRCQKGGRCAIDKFTRTYCKKCRLERCLKIGMKKELIFSKKEMVRTKEMHRKSDFQSNFELKLYDMQMLKEVQLAVASFTSIGAGGGGGGNPQQQQMPPNIAEIAGSMGKSFTGSGSGSGFPSIPGTLLDANSSNSSSSSHLVVTAVPDSLPQVFNFVEHYVGRSIRFCKRFGAFAVLKQDDQMVILKDAFPAIFAVYHAFSYIRERDGFPMAIGGDHNAASNQQSAAFVKMEFSSPVRNITAVFRRFAQTLNRAMDNDATIRDLLIAQILFRQRDDVSCGEFIRYNHVLYCYLLQKYLCTKFKSTAKGQRKYAALKSILTDMALTGQSLRRLYASSINIANISQLVAEIYRLI